MIYTGIMKGYRLFLAYYTLLAVCGLFVWSLFFGPKPQGFLLVLLVLPIATYFAMIFTGHPEEPSTNHRLPILTLAALFVALVAVLAYTAGNPKTPDNTAKLLSEIAAIRQEVAKLSPTQDSSTAAQLRQIKAELANLKATNSASLLGYDLSPVGIVTIKDSKTLNVSVYQEKTLSGKTVGKLEQGKTYAFIDKSPDWYLVVVGQAQGYVKSSLVKELNQ